MDNKELELAGVDVSELLDRFMNNARLVKMVIGKFLEDPTHTKLQAAVESGDLEAAEFACHSLKGVCGNLSLKTLFALTQEQLRLFRTGDGAGAMAMMPQISEQYRSATEHLRLWLAQQ